MSSTNSTVRIAILVLALTPAAAASARAQQAAETNALRLLNGSIAALTERVSPSVVQVLVTSYGPVQQSDRADTDLVIGRQRSMGSGVVIAEGG